MNYIFTKNGERKVENFIQSCIEKRKKIINEGIDTGDLVDNAGKLSINDVLLSINYFHTSNLRKTHVFCSYYRSFPRRTYFDL